MQYTRGFTVVELVVVMVIMAILLALGVAGIGNSQAATRDKQRTATAESLARALEQRYVQGNTILTNFPATLSSSIRQGSYPGYDEMLSMAGQDMTQVCSNVSCSTKWASGAWVPDAKNYMNDVLIGGSKTSFTKDNIKIVNYNCETVGQPAENTTAITTCITNNGKLDQYYYESIDAANNVCDGRATACVRFNIYYHLETNATRQVIRSKHQ